MQGIFLQILIWVLSILTLFLIAFLFERNCKDRKSVRPAHKITIIAVSSALSALLMFFEIPLFFAPSFYKIDLSEIPILICGFYLGPLSGLTAEGLKVIIKLLLKGTTTAFVGDYACFLLGASFILPASILYLKKKTRRNAILSLALGGLIMTVFGSLLNAYYLIPAYSEIYGLPLEVIVSMGTAVNRRIHNIQSLVLYAVVPFNLLKSVIDSLLTFLLYKRIERLFFKK